MRSKRFGERPFMVTLVINVLSPALIVGMILSLVWFLVFAFYQGNFSARLMYVLGLYSFASVLIARISIDSGRAYAIGYLAAMATAAMVSMVKFVTIEGPWQELSWLFNAGLLGLIAYLADRIAFDCTMDDRGKQSLQEGLLQTLRLVKRPTPVPLESPDDEEIDLLDPDRRGPKKRVKHNSGVWVLYFALLALPLFGFGQLVIRDPNARQTAFWFLFAYLGFALMLLICTSFLTIRRYLRDRGMEMPREVTVRWLGGGGLAVALTLIACILLPLPGRTFGVVELPFAIGSPGGYSASRYGWGNETADATNPDASKVASQDDSGEASTSQKKDGTENGSGGAENSKSQSNSSQEDSSDSSQSDSGNSSAKNQEGAQEGSSESSSNQNGSTSDSKAKSNPNKAQPGPASKDSSEQNSSDSNNPNPSADQESADQNSKAQAVDSQSAENESDQASRSPSSSSASQPAFQWNPAEILKNITSSVASMAKWLTILALIVFVLIYAITHPREIAAMYRDFVAFLKFLFGWGKRESGDVHQPLASPVVEVKPLPRFGSFVNPFRSGERLTGSQVVRRSFAALEAWGAELGIVRAEDETPREYVAKLVRVVPQLGKSPLVAANMLDQLTFSNWRPKATDLAPLQQLWYAMTTLHVRASAPKA